MYNFFFKDNNQGKDLWNGLQQIEDKITQEEKDVILSSVNKIANKSLIDLSKDNPNLLVFPHSFNTHNDDVEKDNIFNFNSDNKLHTNNLMGFVGVNDVQLTIGSRFDAGNDKQYFVQYMLQKVFSINLVDLSTQAGNENIWDFLLMYMFPYYLNKAINQGLYKEYKKVKHNDANVKGAIDIARHIRQNIPFGGKIAYNTREFSFDNPTTQLIRHTIEYISGKGHGGVLKDNSITRDNAKLIKSSTTTYNLRERQSVIQQNHKQVNHPFFTEYEELRVICQKILSQQGLSMAKSKDKVHGLLFDGAWLWEEYLNTILKNLDYIHPENKTRKDPIYLFKGNKVSRYPDFYKSLDDDNIIVIDAKYKYLGNSSNDRDDLHQVITYMHVLKAYKGCLLYPSNKKENEKENENEEVGVLNGHGGSFHKYGMKIPNKSGSFISFSEEMRIAEESLKDNYG